MDTNTVRVHEAATDTRGRRISPRVHRSVQQKRRLVAESQVPGASVAEVARRHGVNANLLFVWRRLEERGLLEARTRRGSRHLVPVQLLEGPPVTVALPSCVTSPVASPGSGALRVRFASGIELIVEGTPDTVALARLVALLRC